MAFTNPIWLWAFSALSIPLAIHLLSRKEGKVIAMGSLRHLKDANTQQFKSLRLNEILLLLLRSLIIVLLVLFLSGLQIHKTTKQKWVLVESELMDNTLAKSVMDSLNKQGFESHLLAEGFPILTEPGASPTGNYWQLVEDINKNGISEAVIITSGRAESFKGQRIQQSPSIKWIIINSSPKEYLISAIQKGPDSLIVKTGSIQNENTNYSQSISSANGTGKIYKSNSDSISITKADTLSVLLANDPAFNYDSKIVLASLKTIQKNITGVLLITASTTGIKDPTKKYDWAIWLSEKAAPDLKANQKLLFRNQPFHPLLEQTNQTDWTLSKRLNEKIALEENLTLQLVELLYPANDVWKIANKKDQRILPEQLTWSENSTSTQAGVSLAGYSPLDEFLIALLVIVLVSERIIAYKRNQ